MTSLKEFVNSYKTEDLYVVHTVPKEMREDIRMLPCVSCGGFAERLLDIVMWFSSGGTKSVLHNDGSENLNCLFRGSKELIMINKNVNYNALFDNSGFSNMDVDKVDLKKYSDLMHMDLYKAKISAGDCIFIPQFWLHQVRSFDSNLAVNTWWAQLFKFNETSCQQNKGDTYLNPAKYEFATYEVLRNQILGVMSKHKKATKQGFKKILKRSDVGPIQFSVVFSAFDSNKDDAISFDEVQELPYEQLSKLFPNWQYEPEGEEEEMEPQRDEL
ncbi:Lysine-specific demethylase 8 [Trichoplax sp. H2]|nr:Lysine-specific demethylase 8 [Trichoplax sp. H2]|eukprot:RDD36086.1 Lysine-specific demethylase 8 [Trichoplax sp. H2]